MADTSLNSVSLLNTVRPTRNNENLDEKEGLVWKINKKKKFISVNHSGLESTLSSTFPLVDCLRPVLPSSFVAPFRDVGLEVSILHSHVFELFGWGGNSWFLQVCLAFHRFTRALRLKVGFILSAKKNRTGCGRLVKLDSERNCCVRSGYQVFRTRGSWSIRSTTDFDEKVNFCGGEKPRI